MSSSVQVGSSDVIESSLVHVIAEINSLGFSELMVDEIGLCVGVGDKIGKMCVYSYWKCSNPNAYLLDSS